MNYNLKPARLSGEVTLPYSKSDYHRRLIAAALAEGTTVLPPVPCTDNLRTLRGLEALGARVLLRDRVEISGITPTHGGYIDCGESASTLRFLVPLAAGYGGDYYFRCETGLLSRAMDYDLPGVTITRMDDGYALSGKLETDTLTIDATHSSQYATGALFALAVRGGGTLRLTGLRSAPYLRNTLRVLEMAGYRIDEDDTVIEIAGEASVIDIPVERDESAAAFWLLAAVRGAKIVIAGVHDDDADVPDMGLRDALRAAGAEITVADGRMRASGKLKAIEYDVGDIPDAAPALALALAEAKGTSVLTGMDRLRDKESDRFTALYDGLRALGADVRMGKDTLTVTGRSLSGGTVDCKDDHRLVMAFAILGASLSSPVELIRADGVDKSYPAFWEAFDRLGGKR